MMAKIHSGEEQNGMAVNQGGSERRREKKREMKKRKQGRKKGEGSGTNW